MQFRWVPLTLCLLSVFAPAANLWAAPNKVFSVPARRSKVNSGLVIKFDCRWVEANGYRPVHVEVISTAGPLTADRTIRIEIRASRWRYEKNTPVISKYIELPEKSTRVEATISIPQQAHWGDVDLNVYEDGSEWDDLQYTGTLPNATNQHEWTEATPAILFIDSDAKNRKERQDFSVQRNRGRLPANKNPTYRLPDIRRIAAAAGTQTVNYYDVNQRISDDETWNTLEDLHRMEIMSPRELPEGWINYTCFDLIFISMVDAKNMADAEPEKWKAIREWTTSGTTLCVYGMGEEFENLAELEQLLDLTPLKESDKYRGWIPADPKNFGPSYHLGGARSGGQWIIQNGQQVWVNRGGAYGSSSMGSQPAQPVRSNVPAAQLKKEGMFVTRAMGMGRVAALASEDPFPGSDPQWGWLFNTVGFNRLKWYQRHGMSFHRENIDYWNWLIPGVGLPPVTSFLVLISMFVVVIGPVNYIMLRRIRRLYVLLVTVPAGAMLITCSLLGYAMFTDGLGVKARVRSFSRIDQTNGQAASWSRQSYYAGIRPASGLSFPESSVVYTVDRDPRRGYYRQSGNKLTIDWDENQVYGGNYMQARSTSQFLVVHATKTTARLDIDERGGKAAPRIKNELGAEIDHLLLVDSAGKLFWGEGIDVDESRQLKPIEKSAAEKDMLKIFLAAQPQNPEDFDPHKYNAALNFTNRYNYWGNNVDGSEMMPTFTTSLLEQSIQTARSGVNLQRRNYLAIVERSPLVPLGVKSLREKSSFHVIQGTW